jgi:hypothetical protein
MPCGSQGSALSPTSQIACSEELRRHGFEELQPEGLVSAHFPDTFAPSAFHGAVTRALSSDPGFGARSRFFGCDWVYRHLDQPIVGSSSVHLSSFQMLVFFIVSVPGHRESEQDAIRLTAAVLRRLGVSLRSCTTSVFGGGAILGRALAAEAETARTWTEVGVSTDRVVWRQGPAALTNSRRSGGGVGPRCEVFADSQAGGTFEIATTVFERFIITERAELRDATAWVHGAAFGVERLEMLLQNKSSIFELEPIAGAVSLVRAASGHHWARLHERQVHTVVDGIRTILVLRRSPASAIVGRRAERLARTARIVSRSLDELGIVEGRERLVAQIGKQLIGDEHSSADKASEASRLRELVMITAL